MYIVKQVINKVNVETLGGERLLCEDMFFDRSLDHDE